MLFKIPRGDKTLGVLEMVKHLIHNHAFIHIILRHVVKSGLLIFDSGFFTEIATINFHRYNTRSTFKRQMENLEQENRELREEVTALRTGMANLTAFVESVVATQNQPPPPPPPHATQP